jgi:hypothetical protein
MLRWLFLATRNCPRLWKVPGRPNAPFIRVWHEESFLTPRLMTRLPQTNLSRLRPRYEVYALSHAIFNLPQRVILERKILRLSSKTSWWWLLKAARSAPIVFSRRERFNKFSWDSLRRVWNQDILLSYFTTKACSSSKGEKIPQELIQIVLSLVVLSLVAVSHLRRSSSWWISGKRVRRIGLHTSARNRNKNLLSSSSIRKDFPCHRGRL